MQDKNVVWQNCKWRVERLCLLRVKLKLVDGILRQRGALGPHAMLRRLLETTTDDDLSCPADGKCYCPFLTMPKYDSDRGELSVNGFVIFSIKKHQNLHQVLCSYEELGWPSRIEDPLGTDSENRLRDAVYWLNRRQNPWLIEFSSDGTGCGIRWQFVR
jgi:hypothetical protein